VYKYATAQAWFETFVLLNIVMIGVATGLDLEFEGALSKRAAVGKNEGRASPAHCQSAAAAAAPGASARLVCKRLTSIPRS